MIILKRQTKISWEDLARSVLTARGFIFLFGRCVNNGDVKLDGIKDKQLCLMLLPGKKNKLSYLVNKEEKISTKPRKVRDAIASKRKQSRGKKSWLILGLVFHLLLSCSKRG